MQILHEVECDEYCQSVLRCRMADGYLHPGEVHGDVTEFTPTGKLSHDAAGIVGGFPCQVLCLNVEI